MLLWQISGEVSAIDPAKPRSAHRRHRRKYATGDVREKAFRFRGREGKLDLRAQNLVLFLQMADGVDDDTWTFHLEAGDYARWFREAIKDEALALEAEQVAAQDPDPERGRRMLREAVERRYVLAE